MWYLAGISPGGLDVYCAMAPGFASTELWRLASPRTLLRSTNPVSRLFPMEIQGLLQSQISEIARAIGRSGLEPLAFIQADVDDSYFDVSEPVPAIVYRPAGYWFGFGRHYRTRGYTGHVEDLGHLVGFRPGSEDPFEKRGPLDWRETLSAFQDWITYVRRELAAPDFWAAVSAGTSSILGDVTGADEGAFTRQEQIAITEQLRAIEQQLAEAAGRQSENDAFVRSQFQELRDELAKMKKGKWKTFFIGSLAKMAISHVVPAEAVSAGFDRMSQFFVDHLPQLPHP